MIGGNVPFEGWLGPMVDVRKYDFKYLRDKVI